MELQTVGWSPRELFRPHWASSVERTLICNRDTNHAHTHASTNTYTCTQRIAITGHNSTNQYSAQAPRFYPSPRCLSSSRPSPLVRKQHASTVNYHAREACQGGCTTIQPAPSSFSLVCVGARGSYHGTGGSRSAMC